MVSVSQAQSLHAVVFLVAAVVATVVAALVAAEAASSSARVPIRPARVGVLNPVGVGGGGACLLLCG